MLQINMPEPTELKKFWQCWKKLKIDFPTTKCVRVKLKARLFLDGHRVYGVCKYSEKLDTYTIHIEHNKDISIMIDTLWHEYAHALAWVQGSKTNKHCKKFFLIYGNIYRKYMDN